MAPIDLPDEAVAAAPRQFVKLHDRLVYLRSLEDLATLPVESLTVIAQLLEEERVPAGQVLLKAGEPIDRSYFLVEGRVALYRDGEKVGEIAPPNAVGSVGVIARIDGAPGDIVAEEESLLLSSDAAAMRRLIESDFAILHNTMRTVTRMVLAQRGGLPFDAVSPPDASPGVRPDQPMDWVDKLEWMVGGMAFAGTSLDALGEFARLQREVRYEAGAQIWGLADPSGFHIGIVSGVIEAENGTGRGRLGTGYVLGIFDSIAEVPRGYTATAVTEVVGLLVDTSAMLDVLEDQTQLAMGILTNQASLAVKQLWDTRFQLVVD